MNAWETGGELRGYHVAADRPRAALLLLHGFGEHTGRHAATLHALAAAGIAAYAYDQRGHGDSPGERGFVPSFDALVDDVLAMRARVAAAEPGLPLFLMGQSMGGLLAIRAIQRAPGGVRGAVLCAPALSIGADVPPAARGVLMALAGVLPKLPVASLDITKLARDPAVGAAYVADPLVYHGRVPVRSAAEMARAGDAALAAAPQWHTPTLLFQGTDDAIASADGARRFARDAAGEDFTLRLIDGGYHELLNDPGGDALRAEAARWIVDRADRP
jgi:alpha-beta hydrolase superfamily lysophospholipase